MMRGEDSAVFKHCLESGAGVKKSKPAMEKRRRARINASLAELRSLIPDSVKRDNRRYSKMEKADVLEMAVLYLRHLQEKNRDKRVPNTTSYTLGFNECTQEVSEFFRSPSPLTARVRSSLLDHLQGCAPHKPPDSPSSSPRKSGPKTRGISDTGLSSTSIIARCLLSSTPLPGKQLFSRETSPPTAVSSTSDVGVVDENKMNDQNIETVGHDVQQQDVLATEGMLTSSSSRKRATRRDLTDAFAKSVKVAAISSAEDILASDNKSTDLSDKRMQRSEPEDTALVDTDVNNISMEKCERSTNRNDAISMNMDNISKIENDCIGVNYSFDPVKNSTVFISIHNSNSNVKYVKGDVKIDGVRDETKDISNTKPMDKFSEKGGRLCFVDSPVETAQELKSKSVIESQTCKVEDAWKEKAASCATHNFNASCQRESIQNIDCQKSHSQMAVSDEIGSCHSKNISQSTSKSFDLFPMNESVASGDIKRLKDYCCTEISREQSEKDKELFENSGGILVSGKTGNKHTIKVVGGRSNDKNEKSSAISTDKVLSCRTTMEDNSRVPSLLIPIYVQTSFDESEIPTVEPAFILTNHNESPLSPTFIPKAFKPIAPKTVSAVSSNSHLLDSRTPIGRTYTPSIKNTIYNEPVSPPKMYVSATSNDKPVSTLEKRLSLNVEKPHDKLNRNLLVSKENADELDRKSAEAFPSKLCGFTVKNQDALMESNENQEEERNKRFCSEQEYKVWPLEAEQFSCHTQNNSDPVFGMKRSMQKPDNNDGYGFYKSTSWNSLAKSKCTNLMGKQKILTTFPPITPKTHDQCISFANVQNSHCNLSLKCNDNSRKLSSSDMKLFLNNDQSCQTIEEDEMVSKASLSTFYEKSSLLKASPQPSASNASKSVLHDTAREDILRTALTNDGPVNRDNNVTPPMCSKLSVPNYVQDKTDDFVNNLAMRCIQNVKYLERNTNHTKNSIKDKDPGQLLDSCVHSSHVNESLFENQHRKTVCIIGSSDHLFSNFGEFSQATPERGCHETPEPPQKYENLAGTVSNDVIQSLSCQVSLRRNTSDNEDMDVADAFPNSSPSCDSNDIVVKRLQRPFLQFVYGQNHGFGNSVKYFPYARKKTDFEFPMKTTAESETTSDEGGRAFPKECINSTMNRCRNNYQSRIIPCKTESYLSETVSPEPLNLSKTCRNIEQWKLLKQEPPAVHSAITPLQSNCIFQQTEQRNQLTVMPEGMSPYVKSGDDFEKYEDEDSDVSGFSTCLAFDHNKMDAFPNTHTSFPSVEHLESKACCVRNRRNTMSNTLVNNIQKSCSDKSEGTMCIGLKHSNDMFPLLAGDKLSDLWSKNFSHLSRYPFPSTGTSSLFPASKTEEDIAVAEDDVWRPW